MLSPEEIWETLWGRFVKESANGQPIKFPSSYARWTQFRHLMENDEVIRLNYLLKKKKTWHTISCPFINTTTKQERIDCSSDIDMATLVSTLCWLYRSSVLLNWKCVMHPHLKKKNKWKQHFNFSPSRLTALASLFFLSLVPFCLLFSSCYQCSHWNPPYCLLFYSWCVSCAVWRVDTLPFYNVRSFISSWLIHRDAQFLGRLLKFLQFSSSAKTIKSILFFHAALALPVKLESLL